ncbi:MAG: hypothetical protein ISS87_00450 [Candidatus Pacebacteria bacterium]|nr:hypothetical protein [Candidatus Paceibacterota bacterium]
MENNKNEKPLTLNALVAYNQEVLFPTMKELFVTKKEFKSFKNEFKDFKDENLKGQDKILKKLEILLDEKKIREYQENKQKEMWAIIIKALKEHKILSPEELADIAQLEIF